MASRVKTPQKNAPQIVEGYADAGYNDSEVEAVALYNLCMPNKTDRVTSANLLNLPIVDSEKLKSRLISVAPTKPHPQPCTICFKRPTRTQMKIAATPSAPHLEPLPMLYQYQELHNPDNVQRKAQEKLRLAGVIYEPEIKKRRPDSVEPLERPSSVASLPELPDELKAKQENLGRLCEMPSSLQITPTRAPRHTTEASISVVHRSVDASDFNGITDLHLVSRIIRDNPRLGFMYLTPTVPKSSVHYHYYNLKVADHEHINKQDHCTISVKGVIRERYDDDLDYIPLDLWDQEHTCFEKIMKIPVFYLFRKWKAFNVWRHNVRSVAIQKCKKALNENLFIINPSLRPALLNVREMCYRISDMGLCRIEKGHTYTLTEFKETQFTQLKEVSHRLEEFRELVKEVVRSACRTALLEVGFTPDDYLYDTDDSAPGGQETMNDVQYDMDIYGEAPENMTYTEQANKRAHCKRLACFIRLADYLIVNTMHVLAVNSVSTMLSYLVEQLQNTPSATDIQNWNKQPEPETAPVEEPGKVAPRAAKSLTQPSKPPRGGKQDPKAGTEEEVTILPPLFTTEFVLDTSVLAFLPNEGDFESGALEVIKGFQNTVLRLSNLVPDTYFDAFTRPIINRKFEEKTCGDGPSLVAMFDDDKHLQMLVRSIKDSLCTAFKASGLYAETFLPYKQFYKENEALDLEKVRQDTHDVPFFAESLARYHKQHKMSLSIIEKRPLGMLLVDGIKMKNLLIPSPLRCLDVINDILPIKARTEVDHLIAECQDAQYKLEIEPSSTLDFVQCLNFLDQIQQRVAALQQEAQTVEEMYRLIDLFKVPTPPEDLAVYQTLAPSVSNMMSAIDTALAVREGNVKKFCQYLDKDIAELNKELKVVKADAQNPAILDPTAEQQVIRDILKSLQDKIDGLQKRAFTFKSYQKNFKVEVTKYDELEAVSAEIRMKQVLWDSFDQWEAIVNDWMEAKFETLDPEELTSTTVKYLKTVFQLEKGLPPNGVLPKKKKVPTATLR